jgi:hypothetical protein
MGQRQSRSEMGNEGLRGDLHLEPYESGWRGRRTLLAYLFTPGTSEDMLPRVEYAKVARVRQALTIVGIEAVPRGRKNVQHYRQTWVCSVQPIPPDQWPERPRAHSATGFDPADDDHA